MKNLVKRLLTYTLLLTVLLTGGAPRLFAQSAAPSSQTPETEVVQRYQRQITPEEMASRLYFLASDFFEGREATTRGQRLAALYLAAEYRRMGLAPRGTVKTNDRLSLSAYFQPFNVYRKMPSEARLEVIVNGRQLAQSIFSGEAHDDLAYFTTGGTVDSGGALVFAGYGIADASLGYDDYAALKSRGISIDGKWVMILADEPLADAQTSRLPTADHKPSKWTQLPFKMKALFESGHPAGLLIIGDMSPRAQGTFAEMSARAASEARRIGSPLWFEESPTTAQPPTYTISRKLANQILSSSNRSVESLTEEINRTLKPVVFDVTGASVKSAFKHFPALETENVLAFIEGADPKLKDEVLIISAHYDHLGINPLLKGDQIYNGAADDGSGTVAVLSLAEAFMKAKRDGHGPRRSILFINFTGEERGLLGSAYYTNTGGVVPLGQTVADINMDGIGGFDPKHPGKSENYIYIVGKERLSDELEEINKRLNETTGVKLELTPSPSYFASDQSSFANHFVPFIYYSTGLTDHYHQPSDEPATIAYDHMARVTRLVLATAWQVANQDARLAHVDRSRLVTEGFVCPPCPFECDAAVHKHGGVCPVCGMHLVPNVRLKS